MAKVTLIFMVGMEGVSPGIHRVVSNQNFKANRADGGGRLRWLIAEYLS
jgi:hypothetical protein